MRHFHHQHHLGLNQHVVLHRSGIHHRGFHWDYLHIHPHHYPFAVLGRMGIRPNGSGQSHHRYRGVHPHHPGSHHLHQTNHLRQYLSIHICQLLSCQIYLDRNLLHSQTLRHRRCLHRYLIAEWHREGKRPSYLQLHLRLYLSIQMHCLGMGQGCLGGYHRQYLDNLSRTPL